MNEIKIVYGNDCSKCHQMRRILPAWCEEKGFLYSEENFEESMFKDEIESLPLIVVKIATGEEGFQVSKFTMEAFISGFMPNF